MLVSEELCFDALVKIVPVAAQVRVSLAYVVVMVDHVSYPTTFAVFISDDVGREMFEIAIIVSFYAWLLVLTPHLSLCLRSTRQ